MTTRSEFGPLRFNTDHSSMTRTFYENQRSEQKEVSIIDSNPLSKSTQRNKGVLMAGTGRIWYFTIK
ncbi:hypothetical protein CCACVL1_00777 [Corchorus capsularis]|uniref:Uncharacterized protein n=1 Tax=Corchorus capsularis TaxID=210143 RepID=A0A1R3KUW8_COCAP|nr:hypothetical protein CCACVL1_00777 [Corchorus capsularis]